MLELFQSVRKRLVQKYGGGGLVIDVGTDARDLPLWADAHPSLLIAIDKSSAVLDRLKECYSSYKALKGLRLVVGKMDITSASSAKVLCSEYQLRPHSVQLLSLFFVLNSTLGGEGSDPAAGLMGAVINATVCVRQAGFVVVTGYSSETLSQMQTGFATRSAASAAHADESRMRKGTHVRVTGTPKREYTATEVQHQRTVLPQVAFSEEHLKTLFSRAGFRLQEVIRFRDLPTTLMLGNNTQFCFAHSAWVFQRLLS